MQKKVQVHSLRHSDQSGCRRKDTFGTEEEVSARARDVTFVIGATNLSSSCGAQRIKGRLEKWAQEMRLGWESTLPTPITRKSSAKRACNAT
jgi:hypothetical protein